MSSALMRAPRGPNRQARRVSAGQKGWWRVGHTPDSVRTLTRPRRPSVSADRCRPAPAAYPGVSADGPSSPCVALLRVGFAEPPGSPRALVRSYRTVSPLPVRGRSGDRPRHRRFVFCGTFLRVAPTGCYPAPCPAESGRSSGQAIPEKTAGTRPPGRLATTPIVALNRALGYGHRPCACPDTGIRQRLRAARSPRWRRGRRR
jgi:hypothetical protein